MKICAVATLETSLKATLVNNAINETGYYHLEVNDINSEKISTFKNNCDITNIIKTYNIGSSYYKYEKDKENTYFTVYSIGKNASKDSIEISLSLAKK